MIGNSGLEAVARALTANTTLEEIFLYNNDLDDDAMQDLAAIFRNKDHL